MKLDRLHYTLGAAAVACALAGVFLTAALATSQDEARKYKAVGAYAFINGQNQVLKAIHETRLSDALLERYMTPEGLSAYRASLVPQIPGAKPLAIELPAIDRAALEEVIALANQQPAAAKSKKKVAAMQSPEARVL
jgi:hypothetical protein